MNAALRRSWRESMAPGAAMVCAGDIGAAGPSWAAGARRTRGFQARGASSSGTTTSRASGPGAPPGEPGTERDDGGAVGVGGDEGTTVRRRRAVARSTSAPPRLRRWDRREAPGRERRPETGLLTDAARRGRAGGDAPQPADSPPENRHEQGKPARTRRPARLDGADRGAGEAHRERGELEDRPTARHGLGRRRRHADRRDPRTGAFRPRSGGGRRKTSAAKSANGAGGRATPWGPRRRRRHRTRPGRDAGADAAGPPAPCRCPGAGRRPPTRSRGPPYRPASGPRTSGAERPEGTGTRGTGGTTDGSRTSTGNRSNG